MEYPTATKDQNETRVLYLAEITMQLDRTICSHLATICFLSLRPPPSTHIYIHSLFHEPRGHRIPLCPIYIYNSFRLIHKINGYLLPAKQDRLDVRNPCLSIFVCLCVFLRWGIQTIKVHPNIDDFISSVAEYQLSVFLSCFLKSERVYVCTLSVS